MHIPEAGVIRNFLARCLLGLLAILALGQGAEAAARALTPLRIEVPNARNMQFFTLWVALGAKSFEAEGLAPELVIDPTPRGAGQMLLKGEADVAVLQPPMFLGMMAEGKPIRLFASLLANEPINLIVRKEIAAARNVPLGGSLRERLQALRGLRVGVADEPPPRLRALFAAAGMNADKDVTIVTVHGAEQVQAFADARIDALFAHTPYLETALVRHGAVLVADTSGGEVAELREGQIHALATTHETSVAKRDLIAAAARAIAQAQRLIHSDPKAAVEAILASGVPGLDRALVEAITAVYGPAVPQTPAISPSGVRRAAELYPAHPSRPDFTRIDVMDFVAPEFAAATH
jgi:ABC-type nitrate/sulfonate/bicarbonate transport system substrate-binding protein